MTTDIINHSKTTHKRNGILVTVLTVAVLLSAGFFGWHAYTSIDSNLRSVSERVNDTQEADLVAAYEQGKQDGLNEEKRKAVLIVKEVDGNMAVDIGSHLVCSEDGNGICAEDFDSVKVCVIENGFPACGEYRDGDG